MNDHVDETLSSQLVAPQRSTSEPDWADVRRRAHRLVARRRAVRGGLAGAIALAAIVGVTPALGVRGQIARLFTEGPPAPAPVVKNFSGIDVAAPPGMATGVVGGEARGVMEAPLSGGKTAIVWVAPTKSGGFCTFVSDSRTSLGGGGCDRDRELPFAPGLSIPGISRDGELSPPVVFGGDTLIHGAAAVEIQFEDGTSASTPVTWVTAPIDAGFFVYELPQTHWSRGHRPVALVVRDADGKELANDTEIARGVMSVEERGLPPKPTPR